MNSLSLKPKVLIQEIFQLERCGRYDVAIQKLSSIWEDKSFAPNIEGFNNYEAAEILLRCGSIFGFLGHNKQIPNSQERSKDLISEAHQMFLEIYDVEKIAECENHLALGYWRKGELVEAEVWLECALSHSIPNSCDARLYSHVIKSMLSNGNKKHAETIENFRAVENDFIKYADYYLNGVISSNVGIAYRNLGDTSNALKYLELSRDCYQKAKHKIYSGTTENNLSLFYKSINAFPKAHKAIDNATNIFREINDKTRYGYSFDTKALIYLDEGKYDQAIKTVDEGIKILRKSENNVYLVETLSTKIKILIKLNKIAEASTCLSEAIGIANVSISGEKATKLAELFEQTLIETKAPVVTRLYSEKEFIDDDIELVLPSEISHFEEIEGVWIKNKHLEKVGLKQGSLAIIVKEEVKRGDLVAVLERESEDVICGFYDIDFGIICLEALDRKPQLFDEDEIQILGKIVGVANGLEENRNKVNVELIEISK